MEYGKLLDIKDVCKHLNVSERVIMKEYHMFPDKLPFVKDGQNLVHVYSKHD